MQDKVILVTGAAVASVAASLIICWNWARLWRSVIFARLMRFLQTQAAITLISLIQRPAAC